MRRRHLLSSYHAGLVACAVGLVASGAHASNPLEYPDNGSASFSRGGAWLALANEPIATHYNPAGLAGAASGFSLEQQLNFNKVCFTRQGPGGTVAGPNQSVTTKAPDGSTVPGLVYLPTCTNRSSFPTAIPSISYAWRANRRLGIGVAIVPPATYGIADGGFGLTAKGYNYFINDYVTVPSPTRYMVVDQKSTIVFPTLGIGYEVLDHLRLGAAFISGIGVLNTSSAGVSNSRTKAIDSQGDHAPTDDSLAELQTKDLFIPGFIVSALWSVTPQIDVAVWYRQLDSLRTNEAEFTASTQIFNGASQVAPTTECPPTTKDLTTCSGATPNTFPDKKYGLPGAVTHFEFPLPPELRAGVRFHMPRTKATVVLVDGGEVRDPLHDDLFDVELDGSYTFNSKANTIQIRFLEKGGAGVANTLPINAALPPNADRWNGFIDSYGVRLGGQWNAIPDKLGVRAGFWMETRSQEPEFLNVMVMGAARRGFGGGIVLRQGIFDFSFGYQRHTSDGLDNHGNGRSRAGVAVSDPEWGPKGDASFNLGFEPKGVSAANRTQFRTVHGINGGKMTQSAQAFTLGGTVRF